MKPEPKDLRATREDTIDALCRGFATDELSLGELERRLDRARSARSHEELRGLLADLNVGLGWQRTAVLEREPASDAGPLPRSDGLPEAATSARPSVPGDHPPAGRGGRGSSPVRTSSHLAVAVMAGTRRAGRWRPPTSMVAVALMGGVELDFREAVLSGEDVDITCFAFWGAVEIVVPPGVHVDTRGFALMGGFDHGGSDHGGEVEALPPPPADAPVIRITGLAIMGGIDVRVAERGAALPEKDW